MQFNTRNFYSTYLCIILFYENMYCLKRGPVNFQLGSKNKELYKVLKSAPRLNPQWVREGTLDMADVFLHENNKPKYNNKKPRLAASVREFVIPQVILPRRPAFYIE